MKSIYPASHLLRRFVLFSLTIVFLLTVLRATYALWQFPKLEQHDAVIALFVQGLRFDLALVGILLLLPVVLGSLLSIAKPTQAFAKFLITFFLLVGLFVVLTLEMITPWFIHTVGLRPDMSILADVENPVEEIVTAFSNYTVPLVLGLVVNVLIFFAFCLQMDLNRFLRFRVFVPTGLLLAALGGFLCLTAIWSTPNLTKYAMSPIDALISPDRTVNDLSMNTTYKTIYSLLQPALNKSASAEQGEGL